MEERKRNKNKRKKMIIYLCTCLSFAIPIILIVTVTQLSQGNPSASVAVGTTNAVGTELSTIAAETTTFQNYNVPTTVAGPLAWETCCFNATSGLQYNCQFDLQNDEVTCALGDNKYVELLCLTKQGANQCRPRYVAPNIEVILISGVTYPLKMGGDNSSFLVIQINSMTDGNYFKNTTTYMEKVLSKRDGNFWIGLNLLSYFTGQEDINVALEIEIVHTVNNDAFSVHYDRFIVATADLNYFLTVSGFSFSDADPGVNITDAISVPSASATTANDQNFEGLSGNNCADTQDGAWWMGDPPACSSSNLNSANGVHGWQYSNADPTKNIKFSLMAIGFP